jgi:hypothetical protein
MTGLFNSSWYLGSIVAAWVTYGTFRIESTWSWRIPSLLQGVPAVLQLALVFVVVPESPRWLVANGRDEQALRIITEYHCAGDESDPLAQFEYQEIKEALRIEREINRTSSYKDLFSTPGNRRRMVCYIPFRHEPCTHARLAGNHAVLVLLAVVRKRHHLILPQPRAGRRRHHLDRPEKPHQRYPTALERHHGLRRRTHRGPGWPPPTLAHVDRRNVCRVRGHHRRVRGLCQVAGRRPEHVGWLRRRRPILRLLPVL